MKRFCIAIFARNHWFRQKILYKKLNKLEDFKVDLYVGGQIIQPEKLQDLETIKAEAEVTGQFDITKPLDADWWSGKPKYDAVFVHGDMIEQLMWAISAKLAGNVLIHLQGGEISGNIDEHIRHAITKLSDYHFTCTQVARQYLITMGEEKKRVRRLGCLGIDLMKNECVKRNFKHRDKILVFLHPETYDLTARAKVKCLYSAVMEFAKTHKKKVVWFFPNLDLGFREIYTFLEENYGENQSILQVTVGLSPKEFGQYLAGCAVIIGNSSAGIREASWLGTPAINVGDRQNLRERALNVVDVPYDLDKIEYALFYQCKSGTYKRSDLYGSGRAMELVTKALRTINFTHKTCLTYPLLPEFNSVHFGGDRFDDQTKRPNRDAIEGPEYGDKKRPRNPARRTRINRPSIYSKAERCPLRSEHSGPLEGDSGEAGGGGG